MFAKLVVEKMSSTVCQGIWKEQKRNSDVCKAECREKKRRHDYHAIEKVKSNRIEEMELS